MKKPLDLSLILPCYNEVPVFIESVTRIVDALSLSRLTYEVIFVDDESYDETADLIRKMCKKNTTMRALFHEENQGRGQSVKDGIDVATGKVVGYFDIDCEVSPIYIPHMVRQILEGRTDVVIGNRMYRSSLVSLPREVLSVGYRRLVDRILDTGGLDTETGCKFFNRVKILPIVKKTRHRGWFWDTEIIIRAKRARLRITQVPVLFLRRFDKHSTVRPVRDIMEYLVSIWKFRQELGGTS